MSTSPLVAGFSARLREAMLAEKLHSTRSKSGVCIQQLTKITGHSRQICRKYLEGTVLPEAHVLLKLAQSLNVSAGWLLFGEEPKHVYQDKIHISKTLLHYVLTHQKIAASPLSPAPDFLTNLIDDISQISGDEAHLKQIIDLAVRGHWTRLHEKNLM